MVDLNELAARVEALSGPCREIDAMIWRATVRDAIHWGDDAAMRFTASLDAAMSLVPDDAMWRLGHDGEGADPSQFLAVIVGMTERWWALAATPALALTAAALRARAAMEINND